MKLLITTQALDKDDPVLGFFHGWVAALAPRFERVEVICLREGKHVLPANVRVHSLGKEKGIPLFGAFAYAFRFKLLAWRLRREYDAVFVHMNQEYILIAGPLWRLLGKRLYLWRNHYAGSMLTDIAAVFCTKVFCTSGHSYTAKYKKTVLMPVGVDTERFHPDASVSRAPRSIVFLARVAPSKRPEMFIDALIKLKEEHIDFIADIVGSPLPADHSYYEALMEKVRKSGCANAISFHPAVKNSEAPDIYRTHEIFVNCSPSGMFDKTMFEAAACGCRVLAASEDWNALAGEEASFSDAAGLADLLRARLGATAPDYSGLVARQNLAALADRLAKELVPGVIQ